ncbi:MAG: adenosylhomocysteinase [Oscillospiraceae bacterium]|nr:adenosylhomocysteinase [Oscillospiraceae bacterium]
MAYEILDIAQAPSGRKKIDWVEKHMPIVAKIEQELKATRPFDNIRFSVSVHMEAKTARLLKAIKAGGGIISATGCNPLSTQDDVAAAVAEEGISVFAWHNESPEEYKRHLTQALGHGPSIVIDDGGDLASLLHTELEDLSSGVFGGCEETTTGVNRLRILEREKRLKYPVVAVNNAECKFLFDNRYGMGQSVWDGINRTTNLIVAGKTVVITGYGWCGKGVAMRAKGLGAKIIVCEINPVRAVEAWMDGFDVMPMDDAAERGDFFITVTGCNGVISKRHFTRMKDGAILCNAGHFDVEIDIKSLREIAVDIEEKRVNIKGYKLSNGKWVYVLAEGRLVNLASGDGHPAEIMDMSFALQLLSAKYILENYKDLGNKVISLPKELDELVARYKLETLGVRIDALTGEQANYVNSWNLG